ncbi:MAG TPA: hypothetical protein PLC15_25460 [Candidatus Obscuribacter sp.]|nr:hypothetical protein [Candidatus Obscuribacter sp.]HMY54304.1 hypothetical protein [Candidatus Obscuribacter sp.]HNB18759.1 hypothetical protein [Candidatus Obscuribacter sp.]HNG77657.1 hypothetical protein [Candidatus Obscuribacter sp.]HNH75608.1 hypothetical protein [Candidatus Obscuribacter sp.]
MNTVHLANSRYLPNLFHLLFDRLKFKSGKLFNTRTSMATTFFPAFISAAASAPTATVFKLAPHFLQPGRLILNAW